jgi:hypothetical protein
MIRFAAQFLLLCGSVQLLVYAQVSSGATITGTVLDPHEAGVLGARITLKRVDSNEAQTTNADTSGRFDLTDFRRATTRFGSSTRGSSPTCLA